jgi:spore maturation protein CgeB
MNIIYIGDDNNFTTSFHRATALGRLGNTVTIQNPYEICKEQLQNYVLGKIHFRTGYFLLQKKIENWLLRILSSQPKPDLIWVNGGELIGKKCVQVLKQSGRPVILYNNDDPTGGRDGNRFNSLLNALAYYDLCVVMRNTNVSEFEALGSKHVIRMMMSYDEEAHKPYNNTIDIPIQFRSEVAFIGTWMRHEKRDEFLLQLIQQGIPISIWGSRWNKSPLWPLLKFHYRGEALKGRDYVAAIQGAKICLGLLSKGNRDTHTTRSLEVPYAGGLLCAERTSEHSKMYQEGVEAVFWSDVTECADRCKELLANDELRERIRLAGMRKVRELGAGNEDVCQKILQAVDTHHSVLQNQQ